jgi:hypothetical protein
VYDSYDGTIEYNKEEISKLEKTKKMSKITKKMFSQNDEDGNPFNGYNPKGNTNLGTPKVETEPVLKEDLGVWFGTKKKPKGSKQPKGPWVNICRKDENGKHPPCGRPDASSKGYPKCRAAGVAGKMSDSQKKAACAQKRRAEKKDTQTGKGQKPVMTSYKPKNESLRELIKSVLREQII